MQVQIQKNPFVRSPTLDTVLMVEKTVDKYSGDFDRTELWKKLPKKVMWQTYLIVLDYLYDINKIAIDQTGKIAVTDVMAILECPKRTAQLHLQKLKGLKMIKQIGKGPSSAYILE